MWKCPGSQFRAVFHRSLLAILRILFFFVWWKLTKPPKFPGLISRVNPAVLSYFHFLYGIVWPHHSSHFTRFVLDEEWRLTWSALVLEQNALLRSKSTLFLSRCLTWAQKLCEFVFLLRSSTGGRDPGWVLAPKCAWKFMHSWIFGAKFISRKKREKNKKVVRAVMKTEQTWRN